MKFMDFVLKECFLLEEDVRLQADNMPNDLSKEALTNYVFAVESDRLAKKKHFFISKEDLDWIEKFEEVKPAYDLIKSKISYSFHD